MVLSASMNHDVWQVYKYCPRCGTALVLTHNTDGQALKCPLDNYTFFQNPHTAVAAIIRNTEGQILLIKRGQEPQKGMWDLPGGFVNWSEDPEVAVVREVQEELGVRFYPASTFSAGHDWYLFEELTTSVNSIGFIGTIDGEIVSNEEIGSLHWFAPKDLPDNNISFDSLKKTFKKLRD